MITLAEAEEILAAFGPLSILDTTTTAVELLEDIQKFDSPREYIEKMIVVEDVTSDRMAAAAREQEASGEECFREQHLHVVADEVEFMKLIKDRTTALMARKGW